MSYKFRETERSCFLIWLSVEDLRKSSLSKFRELNPEQTDDNLKKIKLQKIKFTFFPKNYTKYKIQQKFGLIVSSNVSRIAWYYPYKSPGGRGCQCQFNSMGTLKLSLVIGLISSFQNSSSSCVKPQKIWSII